MLCPGPFVSDVQNGTRSADPIRASGLMHRINRPDTKPLLTRKSVTEKSCHAGAIHTGQSSHSRLMTIRPSRVVPVQHRLEGAVELVLPEPTHVFDAIRFRAPLHGDECALAQASPPVLDKALPGMVRYAPFE